jgi:dihydrofolate synthase / folylpolyglutamate synthase
MDRYLEGKCFQDWQPKHLDLPLLGYHQIENAATAYAALLAAQENGLTITAEDIRIGFKTVDWPGRFEVLCQEPMLVVDSAHNADSALKLRLALDDYFPGRSVVLLFGVSEDKDLGGMFNMLLPRVRQVIATQAIHPRALEAEKIVAMAHEYGCPAQAVLPLENALQRALEAAGDDAVVVAAGSLFIAAAVRTAWQALQLKCPQV